MRTKLLFAAAAIIATGALSGLAQGNVYSLNIVGYVNKPCPLGLTAVANPLNAPDNKLSTLIPAAPDFSQVLKWNPEIQDFEVATMFFGAWDNDLELPPGAGFFVNPSAEFTNTFVGEVLTGDVALDFGGGLNMVGSKVPVGGDADSLGLTAALSDFDQLLKWDSGINDYVTYTLFFGSWDLGAPSIGVGEGFFINTSSPGTWLNTLNP